MNNMLIIRRLWYQWKAIARNASCTTVAARVTQPKSDDQFAEYSNLRNGIRIVTETRRNTSHACIGLYIDAGSRYENRHQNGLSHFFQYLVFKSTKKRNRTNLMKAMAATGGNFGSFITREMVCFYVQCLKQQIKPAVEILCDCVFNNSLSDAEILNQQYQAYCGMINSDKDLDIVMYDYLHSAAFQGTPLEQTVIGSYCNMIYFNKCAMESYLTSVFIPSRSVLAAVGDVTHDQIRSLAKCYLDCLQPSIKANEDIPYRYTGSDVRYRDDSMPAANVIIAVEGPSWCHHDNIVMDVARCAVGGWDRSQVSGDLIPTQLARTASTLHLCDAYKSFNINYKDTGLWGVQFTSDVMSLDNMTSFVQGEWMYLCNCITETEVDRAKRFLTSHLCTKMQSVTKACHDSGRWVLYYGSRPSLFEKMKAIDNVQMDDMRRVCTRYLYDKCPTVVALGRIEGLMEYQRIRSGMYWLRF